MKLRVKSGRREGDGDGFDQNALYTHEILKHLKQISKPKWLKWTKKSSEIRKVYLFACLVNLAWAKVILEEGPSTEEIPLPD